MDTLALRQQQVLYDKKWMIFLRRARLFRACPFVEFVLAAGSMATGAVHEHSDFDVIVATREGRIFTARFFAVLFFGLFGWRRARISHTDAARDKICLNHFITRLSFRLAPPHTDSWRELYRSLISLYGSRERIAEFFRANSDWTNSSSQVFSNSRFSDRRTGYWPPRNQFCHDLRYDTRGPNRLSRFLALSFSGRIGDVVERLLRAIQIWKIEYSIQRSSAGHHPRIRYTDSELEFHPDRAKFERIHHVSSISVER